MRIKHIFFILAIIGFSNLFAQSNPFAKIKTSEDATVYLKLISENFKAGDEKILPILIKKGADVNVINKSKITPLVSMIFANSTQGAKILLDAGAKTDIIFPKSYDTPITLAIRHGVKNKNLQILDLFINAKVDVNFKNISGDTPLNAAIMWNSPAIMTKLIKAGADPKVGNSSNITPLHSAIIKGNISFTEQLIKAGADINAQTSTGETPLIRAIKFDPVYLSKNINKLIELGADVNLSTNEKKSPLYFAAERKNRPLVQKLLKAGAKVNHQSLDGSTALYIASSLGYTDIVKSLLDAKANRTIGKKKGNTLTTPLDVAKANKHTATVTLLKTLPFCSGKKKYKKWKIDWYADRYNVFLSLVDVPCRPRPYISITVSKNGTVKLKSPLIGVDYQKLKIFVDRIKIYDGYDKDFKSNTLLKKMYKGKIIKIEYWTAQKKSDRPVYVNDLKFHCVATLNAEEFQLVNQIGQNEMLKASRSKQKGNCQKSYW